MSSTSKFIGANNYLNLDLIESYNAPITFITGQRSCGKSYGLRHAALNDWFTRQKQFIYVRRYDKEFNISRVKDYFEEHHANDSRLAEQTIVGRGGEFILKPDELPDLDDWEETGGLYSKKERTVKTPGDVIGYYLALSNYQAGKSSSFSNVRRVFFDEFIIEDTRYHHYLTHEVNAFMNIAHTIIRNRTDAKITLMANAAAQANPYFEAYGVKASDFADGNEVVWRKNKKVLFININDTQDRSTIMSDIAPDSYLDFAVNNRFRDDTNDFIETQPLLLKPMYTFTIDDTANYRIWRLSPQGNNRGCKYWVQRLKEKLPDDGGHFCLTPTLAIEGAPHSPMQRRTLKAQIDSHKVLFDSVLTRTRILESYGME